MINLDESFWSPLGFGLWLTIHVPVTVWSVRSIGWVDLLVLVLNDLVFMVVEILASVENWVINWLWLPVRVVRTMLSLVGGFSSYYWLRWLWLGLSCLKSLACSNNSVAKVILKWNIISTELPSAIW